MSRFDDSSSHFVPLALVYRTPVPRKPAPPQRPRRKPVSRLLVLAFIAWLASLAMAIPARATPKVGSARPEVVLRDAWDRTLSLSVHRGRPIVLVYEDKDSGAQNRDFKRALAELMKDERIKRRIAVIAIADVSGYDYWPVRGIVKDAIRDESHKQGTIIYCDWDGRARSALALDRGASNVVAFGKDGRVLFAFAGALSIAQQREVVALLRGQVVSM